jgi:hypothetical protein
MTNKIIPWQGLFRGEINVMIDNEHEPQLCVLWDGSINTFSLS